MFLTFTSDSYRMYILLFYILHSLAPKSYHCQKKKRFTKLRVTICQLSIAYYILLLLFFPPCISLMISSLVGRVSGSGFFLIQIVFSIQTAGFDFNSAFIVIFSSRQSIGMISSLPEKLQAEEVSLISLMVIGCHLPSDIFPS